jgi:hypothetical protein
MRTIYEANDGSQFKSSEECQQHEFGTKFNKYKNYTGLNGDINDLYIGNNTDLPSMVAFVIDNIELINNMINADLEPVYRPEEFTAGQTILVRLSPWDDWEKKVFVRYSSSIIYPYICEYKQVGNNGILYWKYAKSIR